MEKLNPNTIKQSNDQEKIATNENNNLAKFISSLNHSTP